MSKLTTPDAFDDHTLVISRPNADHPGVMLRTELSMPTPIRVAIAASFDAPAAPELPVSRPVRLRAIWRKTEGGGLVCHWTRDPQ
ncbi:hypothetical protein GCM10027093_72160 [Paraburkholderia jirisanensis]